MASSPPSKTVVNFIKTTNSATRLRKQYSVEVIDLQHLAALGCVELPHSGDACSEPMRTGGKHQQDIIEHPKFTLFPILPVELRLKIWKMAAFPRIVFEHWYQKNVSGSGALFTPCIPVLMHTSREARQVALEIYEIVQEPTNSTIHMQPGPIYFNFKLDIFVGMNWNGRDFSGTSISRFPTRITDKVRQVAICDWGLVYKLGMEDLSTVNGHVLGLIGGAESAYELLRDWEKLETILVLNTYGRPRQSRPWKTNILKDTDWVVQGSRDDRSDLVARLVPWWKVVLKEAEVMYPGWKAPKLELLHLEFVEQTIQTGGLLHQ